MDFLQDELNFLRNIQIFKKNSAKYCEKYIPQDLMGSILVRLACRVVDGLVVGADEHAVTRGLRHADAMPKAAKGGKAKGDLGVLGCH